MSDESRPDVAARAEALREEALRGGTLREESLPEEVEETVELRDPLVAAGLALLLPGLGHFYQRRNAKAVLYMVCILGMYLFGWQLGGGKVVYAQWEPDWRFSSLRWPYVCQVWVGVPAWPALIQSGMGNPLGEFMAAPNLTREQDEENEVARWHRQYTGNFELGTVFTMVAGLLNILVIFDAGAGPVGAAPVKEKKTKKKKRDETAD